jgi:hypothetical protein
MSLTEEGTEVPKSGGSEESKDKEIPMSGGQEERDERRRDQWEESERHRKIHNEEQRRLRERIPLETMRTGSNEARHSKFTDAKARYVRTETEETCNENYIYKA